MKKIKLFLPFFIIFLFTGCYNYRELNQLALTSAIGIDKDKDGFNLTIQILNTQKSGSDMNSSGEQPKFVIYQKKGRTIQEALREVILESPRRIYANHLDLLVVSEEVAKSGIHEILDFFARNTEIRKQFLVVVCRDQETEDVLNILTPLEVLNAKNIKNSILSDSKYLGISTKISYEDLLNRYLNDKIDIVLPSVQLVGNKKKGEKEDNINVSNPEASILLKPFAVFRKDKLIGYLNRDQSIAYNYIQDNINSSIVTYSCPDGGNYSVEIIQNKTKLSPVKGKPKIKIVVKANGSIKEINCNMDLTKPSVIKQIEKTVASEIKKDIEKAIRTTIDTFHTDIYGFQELIYKNNPTFYKQLKREYDDTLIEHLDFDVDINIKLQTKGNIVRVIER